MKTFLKNFIADESGASAAEYALIIAVVGVGIGAAALVLGTNISTAVGDASDEVAECAQAGGQTVSGTYVDTAAGETCA